MSDEQHDELSALQESLAQSPPAQPEKKPRRWTWWVQRVIPGVMVAFALIALMPPLGCLAGIVGLYWLISAAAPSSQPSANSTLACGILSVVTPILGCIFVPIGLIAAIIALVRKPTSRPATVGLVLCLCGAVLQFAVYSPMMGRFVFHAKEMARSAGCNSQLIYLGKAIAAYRAVNDDQYPPNLNALLQDGSQSIKMLACPEDPWDSSMWDETRDDYLPSSSYFYLVPQNNSDTPDGDACIIACDAKPLHPASKYNIYRIGGRRNALWSDGSAQTYTEEEFQQELQKSQNRRFAEELAKAANMTPQQRAYYPTPVPPEKLDPPPDSQPSSPPDSPSTQEATDE